MKCLTRYIQKELLLKCMGAVLGLALLKSFLDFGQELRDVGIGHYGVTAALVHTALLLPSALYEFFPVGVLLGALIALGGLAANNELLIMKASGASKGYVIRIALVGLLLLTGVVAVIGEGLAPSAINMASQMKTQAMSSGQALNTGQGVWLRSHNDFLHINNINDEGYLHGILRYHFTSEFKLASVSYAQKGSYHDGQWRFTDIEQSRIRSDSVQSRHIPQQNWSLAFRPQFLSMAHLKPREKSLPQLYRQIQVRRRNGLQSNQLAFSFWQRIFQPLAALATFLLVVPFMFGSLSQSSIGLRIVVGSLGGISFYLMERFVGPLGMIYQIPPFWSALLPVLALVLVGLLIWRRF